MTRLEMEKAIIEKIKEAQIEKLGNYSYIDTVKNAICEAMFSRCISEYAGSRYTSWHGGEATDEQKEKVEKVYNGLLKKGYLKLSKSELMVKLVKED